MKKLLSKLGSVGIAIYWIVAIVLFVMPLAIIGLPWWANILIYCVILGIPFVGEIAEFGVFVWAFVIALNQPFDLAILLFYISAVIYVVTTLIPAVAGYISDVSRNIKHSKEDEGMESK